MNAVKHTPGPWYLAGDADGTMITTGGQPIAVWPPQGGTIEQCANARLITTAPDMFDVLSLLVHGDGQPDKMPRIMADARAALAKAKGK
jgi:hypothetical protein